jgi:hypothetical protein
MFNPPPSQDPGSYFGLLKRMTDGVQQKLGDQILTIIQNAYERQLEDEKVVLSRPERVRLYQQIAKTVLTEALAKIDDHKKGGN